MAAYLFLYQGLESREHSMWLHNLYRTVNSKAERGHKMASPTPQKLFM